MNIAILGSGNVGVSLARGWAAKGHAIVLGVRDPGSEKAKAAQAAVPTATLLSTADAAAVAEVIVLALPYSGVEPVTREIASVAAGKIVIDPVNAIDWSQGPRSALGSDTSVGEIVQQALPGAMVVKAFNTIGADHMANPKVGGQTAVMPICGDDADARMVVAGLATDLGFDAVDVGPLFNARLLEPMGLVWIYLATQGGLGRNIAFSLARGT